MLLKLFNLIFSEEALAALKEAIKISQEVNDNVCLQHALSWLVRLSTVNKDKLIVHCVSKSIDLNLTYTTSLGIQTMGQCGFAIVGMPLAIFEVNHNKILKNKNELIQKVVSRVV